MLEETQRKTPEAICQHDVEMQQILKGETYALNAKIELSLKEQDVLKATLTEVNQRKEAEFWAFKLNRNENVKGTI